MAKGTKVVFRADVRGIAQVGDVKSVSAGYARNYLFPRNLAYPADGPALRQWDTERLGALTKAARLREEGQSLAQKVESLTCTIAAKAGTEGRLFGSIGRQVILQALAKEGLPLDRHALVLTAPLKQLGAHAVPVRLPGGVQAQLKINVVPENG